jgi:hypothetical protein
MNGRNKDPLCIAGCHVRLNATVAGEVEKTQTGTTCSRPTYHEVSFEIVVSLRVVSSGRRSSYMPASLVGSLSVHRIS